MEQIINFIVENLPLVILSVVGVVFFMTLIIIVIKLNNKDAKDHRDIMANLTTPRIFVLDFNEGVVTYFNRGQYSERKRGQISQFFHQFTAKEVEDLEAWVNNLLVPKSGVDLVYKVDVFVRSQRRSYASILEVSKIDYDKQIIHLESYLYRYLKPNNQMNFAVRKRENIGYLGSTDLTNLYNRRYKRLSGIYGAINIKNTIAKKSDKHEVSAHIRYELQNQTAFFRSRRNIIRLGTDNTVGIYMPRSHDEALMKETLGRIIKRMEAYLEINGYDEYTIGAGIVRAKEFSDINMGLKTAEELSVYAHKSDPQILVYDATREVKDLDLSLYRNEVKQIIIKKEVDTLFQPLVVASSAEIYGYLTNYTIKSPLFTTYHELNMFSRESKQSALLTEMVLRKTAASYYNARRNAKQKLFVPLDVDDVTLIDEAFSKLPFAADMRFVFMIEEQNFSERFALVDDMLSVVRNVKKLGHEVALIITDTELTLPDDIYSVVDYFMVNEQILVYTRHDERERLYLLSMLGKLLRHDRLIAIMDLARWSDIEYYVRAGVDLIASDEISRKDTSLQTIEKKKALRIINFSKRK